MTALNFLFEPNRVCIAMDTMSVEAVSKRPSLFTTKIFPLVHLGGVMCGTGNGPFVLDWFLYVQSSVLVRDIPHLDEFAPEQLRKLAAHYNLSEKNTVTIYQFEFSDLERRYRGFAYRSEKSFASEELQYGIGTKPPIEVKPIESLPEGFIELMKRQHAEDQCRPVSEQVGIGGDIHFFVMTESGMSLSRCHRFENREVCYNEMLRNVLKV